MYFSHKIIIEQLIEKVNIHMKYIFNIFKILPEKELAPAGRAGTEEEVSGVHKPHIFANDGTSQTFYPPLIKITA